MGVPVYHLGAPSANVGAAVTALMDGSPKADAREISARSQPGVEQSEAQSPGHAGGEDEAGGASRRPL
jgi:hypothetical protein